MVQLVLEVLQIVAPVFLLAAIGFTWVRMGLEYRVEFVTRLAMTLAIPCLIFTSLVTTEIDPELLRDTAIASLLAYGLLGTIVVGLIYLLGKSQRTYFAPLTFGNTGNLGLPLALFAFGPEGLSYAVIIFSIMAVLSFTIGLWVVAGGGSVLPALKEPMVGATVLGLIFLVNDWSVPRWTFNTLDLIGQMGIPLMLITLGVALSRLRPGAVGRAIWMSLVKLALSLAIGVSVGLLLDLPNTAFAVLVLQIATPVAVTNYLLAAKFNADADEVAGLVVVSTLTSVAAIPVILGFFV